MVCSSCLGVRGGRAGAPRLRVSPVPCMWGGAVPSQGERRGPSRGSEGTNLGRRASISHFNYFSPSQLQSASTPCLQGHGAAD